MNDRCLHTLEFDKIKDKIKSYVITEAAKEIVDNLSPYNNIYDVRSHIEETKEASELLSFKGSVPFEGLFDARNAVSKAEKGSILMPSQLLKIANILKCARRFKEYVRSTDDGREYNVLNDICSGINPLKNVEDAIFFAIVSDDEINDRASITLYNIRKDIKKKSSSIKDKITSLIRSNSKYLQDNLYTIREGRYVLPVRSEYKNMVKGLVHDQSATGATLFIEPMALVNLNNDIKELMLKEKAEVQKILMNLSGLVYDEIISVKNNSQIVYELDFIFAKAKYSQSIYASVPLISENGTMDIINGRHPLIDPKKVVPISIKLGDKFSSLIITGPNTGGKTVTLKTAGLIHIMALSGLLIPASEGSTVAFFKEIFADIGDEQSIEQSLSTFSSHMTNIVKIINEADENSLVLLDELGAGTDPVEGAALAVSILEYLKSLKVKLIATTHYSEIKVYALKTENVENASVEFDVETLRPTYRLLIGIPGKSNAFEISKRLGMPDYIIDEARKNVESDSLQFEDLLQKLQSESIKAEKEANLRESLRLEVEKVKDEYEKKISSMQKIRENTMHEAKREARSIIRDAKEEADGIIKNIRQLENEGYDSGTKKEIETQRRKLKEKMDKLEEKVTYASDDSGEPLKKVSEGQEVYISNLDQNGIVISLPNNKGEVELQVGIMKINAKLNDLRKCKKNVKEKRQHKGSIKLSMLSVKPSIDLRGMDSEEAIYSTDKYLDDAFMAGLNEVTVIHGKGNGILRQAIGNMLKRQPHVKSYRLGEYGEGGSGVTVVELK